MKSTRSHAFLPPHPRPHLRIWYYSCRPMQWMRYCKLLKGWYFDILGRSALKFGDGFSKNISNSRLLWLHQRISK